MQEREIEPTFAADALIDSDIDDVEAHGLREVAAGIGVAAAVGAGGGIAAAAGVHAGSVQPVGPAVSHSVHSTDDAAMQAFDAAGAAANAATHTAGVTVDNAPAAVGSTANRTISLTGSIADQTVTNAVPGAESVAGQAVQDAGTLAQQAKGAATQVVHNAAVTVDHVTKPEQQLVSGTTTATVKVAKNATKGTLITADNATKPEQQLASNTLKATGQVAAGTTKGAVATTSSIETSVLKVAGEPAVLTMNVLGVDWSAGAQHANGTMTVTSGGLVVGVVQLTDGHASLDLGSLGHGVHILDISYGGGQGIQASSTVLTVVL
ncbi:MAG TPA: hypothetical protein VHE83_05920 [Mycobacteriales bacterium]|nr:hypothetical protein [Mycobacteriales bacterium]